MKRKTKALSLLLIAIIFIFTKPLSIESNTSNICIFSDNYFIRNNPKYDYVIGNDRLPHFRVAFWVPEDTPSIIPYTPYNIITNISNHGSIENWTVIESNIPKDDMKLIYVFVPKRFVFLYGENFWKYVSVKYEGSV